MINLHFESQKSYKQASPFVRRLGWKNKTIMYSFFISESSQSQENEDLDALFKSYMNNDDGEDEGSNTHKRPEDWRIGDRCLALWIQDGLYVFILLLF